jgi:AcrR family transcriptional regulator
MSSKTIEPLPVKFRRNAGVLPKNGTSSRPLPVSRPLTVEEKLVSPRDRLVATARRLFCQEGLRAVGIDRVLAEAGVAKMTLYRYFASKDELIVACLAEHEREYWELWEREANNADSTPVGRMLNVIHFIARRTSDPAYQGCIFLNAAQSFPDKTHPAHHVAVQHKQSVATRLLKLGKDAGADNPRVLGQQLLLLINGTQATAGMLGRSTQWAIVGAAETLLRAQGIVC